MMDELLARADAVLHDLSVYDDMPGVALFWESEGEFLNDLQTQWHPIRQRWWGASSRGRP